jgi:hypothetical protein
MLLWWENFMISEDNSTSSTRIWEFCESEIKIALIEKAGGKIIKSLKIPFIKIKQTLPCFIAVFVESLYPVNVLQRWEAAQQEVSLPNFPIPSFEKHRRNSNFFF